MPAIQAAIMTPTHRLQSNQSATLLAGVLGLALGLGFGCGARKGNDCEGSNNTVNADGICVCPSGYGPCDPDDPDNPDCCQYTQAFPCDTGSNNRLNDDGECVCLSNYEWCEPDDVNDLNCCPVAMDTGTDDVGTTG